MHVLLPCTPQGNNVMPKGEQCPCSSHKSPRPLSFCFFYLITLAPCVAKGFKESPLPAHTQISHPVLEFGTGTVLVPEREKCSFLEPPGSKLPKRGKGKAKTCPCFFLAVSSAGMWQCAVSMFSWGKRLDCAFQFFSPRLLSASPPSLDYGSGREVTSLAITLGPGTRGRKDEPPFYLPHRLWSHLQPWYSLNALAPCH